MINFVNQKIIDGKTYTAYRDEGEPDVPVLPEQKKPVSPNEVVTPAEPLVPAIVLAEYVECDGVQVPASLDDVWNDPKKLTTLFDVSPSIQQLKL